MYIDIGEKLKILRKSKGLSLKSAAKLIDVTYQQLQKYESGVNRVPVDKMMTLCSVYNIAPDEFIRIFSNSKSKESNEVFSLASKETLTLVRAFNSLSPSLKRSVINFVEGLATSNSDNTRS